MERSLAGPGKEYTQRGLSEDEVAADPFTQFQSWFSDALAAQLTMPNAMTLATASRDGKPSARIVLLKGFDEQGFVFYTNYESRKGHELAENPWATLVFFWAELERQVRIEGQVEYCSAAESDAYFQSRPLLGSLAERDSLMSQAGVRSNGTLLAFPGESGMFLPTDALSCQERLRGMSDGSQMPDVWT